MVLLPNNSGERSTNFRLEAVALSSKNSDINRDYLGGTEYVDWRYVLLQRRAVIGTWTILLRRFSCN
jgi:hypothetical protein